MSAPKDPHVTFAQAVRSFRENLPAMMEHDALKAKILWSYYQSLKREGFTGQQALELTKVKS